MFNRLFGRRAGPGRSASSPLKRTPFPTDLAALQQAAMQHVQALTGAQRDSWGFGSSERWDVDLERGEISFTFSDKVARAPVQLIATYSERDGTLLWGWDHPSATPETAHAAKAVKAHADLHGIVELQAPKLACESIDAAWPLASIAVLVAGLQGIYRGPAGPGVYAFLGFGTVTLARRKT